MTRRIIVKLCEDTPKLALSIVQPGCQGRELMDTNIEIRISKKGCPAGPVQQVEEDNCSVTTRWVLETPPAVIYPAFDIDEDGRVEFYFDDRLWNMPSGRYVGEILIGGYPTGAVVDIDLCNSILSVASATVKPITPCGDSQC